MSIKTSKLNIKELSIEQKFEFLDSIYNIYSNGRLFGICIHWLHILNKIDNVEYPMSIVNICEDDDELYAAVMLTTFPELAYAIEEQGKIYHTDPDYKLKNFKFCFTNNLQRITWVDQFTKVLRTKYTRT